VSDLLHSVVPKTFEATASKRVSFIITTKNRADFLKETLEKHRSLFHPEDELIIIDGFSTDSTAEVVRQYADMVDIFVSEPDCSAAHALNKGILLARGKYVKQLPDDDVIYPDAMEQAIGVLEIHPEVDMMVCGGTRVIGDRSSNVYLPPGYHYGDSVMTVFDHGACGTGFIFRRSAFSLIGLLHPTNAVADQEIVLRSITRGANVKFCRINLFYHRIFGHSVSVSWPNWDSDRVKLVRQYYPSRLAGWYLLRRRFGGRLLPWLVKHERLANALRRVRRVFVTSPPRAPEEPIWDGGFS